MVKVTTALRKISALRKKIRVVQGGQGSSKTFSILMLLINHASSNADREILILSAELTKMRITVIKDFVKVMKMFGIFEERRFIAGTLYRFPNGSFIKFIGLDKEDVGKGLRSDIAFFNEVNKIEDIETFRQVQSRAGLTICDFNPDAEFFIHKEYVERDDCDLLTLTFEDNEEIPSGERDEILMYYEKGYGRKYNPNDPKRNSYPVISKYWANKWRVYGLGEIGAIDGVVYERWEEISEIPKEARLVCNGIDFGYSISKFASVDIYKYNGTYIFDELVYDNKLTNPQAAEAMYNAGYDGDTIAYCDSAEPKSIQELQDNGINAVACENKRDIRSFAIKKLNTEPFYVTKRSVNIKMELRSYVWDEKTGKPKKSDKDHLMNAIEYGVGSEDMYTGDY